MGAERDRDLLKFILKTSGGQRGIIWPPFLLAGVFIGLGLVLPGHLAQETGDPEAASALSWMPWVGAGVFFFAIIFNLAWARAMGSVKGVVSKKKIRRVFLEGERLTATVLKNYRDHRLKRGQIPWTVLELELPDGSQAEFGSFAANVDAGVDRHGKMEVYVHPGISGYAIPAQWERD